MQEIYSSLFSNIDRLIERKDHVFMAIDGRSCSGKTTLARSIFEMYGCNVVHMDDFFLRPEQRTQERYLLPGGNSDRERLIGEVLGPLSLGLSVKYRRFDCKSMSLAEEKELSPRSLTVVEGSYSAHPELRHFYDICVYLDLSKEFQLKRLSRRSDIDSEEYINRWLPLEESYLMALDIKNSCDIVIDCNMQ